MSIDASARLLGQGRPVTVVGGGFSGLVAALHLARAGFSVELRETSSRVGGLINTVATPFGIVETAANGLLNTAAVEELFALAKVDVVPTLKESKARFVFRAGRPRRWPLSIMETMRLFIGVLRLGAAREHKVRPRETIAAWGQRFFSTSISRYTLETGLQGIYAGDPSRMSASLILAPVFRSGRATRKPKHPGTVSARGGMKELIEGIRRAAQDAGVRIRTGAPVTAEELQNPKAPFLVATSAFAAARLLEIADSERSSALKEVEPISLVSATLHFPRESSSLKGFGCLFPPGEARVLGVLFNNHIFPGRSSESLSETWILGGAMFKDEHGRSVTDLEDQEILDLIRDARRSAMKSETSPIDAVVTRWEKALPHFTVEMEDAALRFRPNRGNLFLLGNYTGGIGLSKILEQAILLPEEIARNGQWK